ISAASIRAFLSLPGRPMPARERPAHPPKPAGHRYRSPLHLPGSSSSKFANRLRLRSRPVVKPPQFPSVRPHSRCPGSALHQVRTPKSPQLFQNPRFPPHFRRIRRLPACPAPPHSSLQLLKTPYPADRHPHPPPHLVARSSAEPQCQFSPASSRRCPELLPTALESCPP